MSDDQELSGGCLCGGVRYRVAQAPVMSGKCHCLSCQKLSGSGHSFLAMVPAEALHVEGQVKGYQWSADSGNAVTTSFCPTCGSPLFGETSGFPGMRAFRVASLDDPSRVSPQMSLYTDRLQPWDQVDASAPAFPLMPPVPDELGEAGGA